MRGSTGRGLRITAAGLAVALLAACGTSSSGGSSAGGGDGKPGDRIAVRAAAPLAGDELRYGASAHRSSAIRYQPDVVLVEDGAKAIKAATADGLLWTLDGRAPGVADLRPGSILLATSFAAGRVLALKHVGSDVQVALGPVALTDVVRDGTISSGSPLALSGFQAYSTPDQPGLASGGSGQPSNLAAAATRLRTALDSAAAPSVPDGTGGIVLPTAHLLARPAAESPRADGAPLNPFPPPASAIPASEVANWHVQSSCCTDAEIRIKYDKGGARVLGTALLGFTKPSLSFSLKIGGGHLIDASVSVDGAAKLGFGIAASVKESAADFKGGRIQLPVDLDIPLAVAGLPMTLSIHQIFSVGLGLSGAAELDINGLYQLGGRLGFSLVDGHATVLKPTLTTERSALDSIHSIAVAPQGLTFAYAVKLGIGIGPPGLNAGIWYQVAAALGVATSGSRIDPFQGTSLVTCKTVSLSVQGRYGVGYQIPKLVAAAVNLFLSVFAPKARRLEPVGGPVWGPSILYSKSTPPCSKS